jgi:hypothetical protein
MAMPAGIWIHPTCPVTLGLVKGEVVYAVGAKPKNIQCTHCFRCDCKIADIASINLSGPENSLACMAQAIKRKEQAEKPSPNPNLTLTLIPGKSRKKSCIRTVTSGAQRWLGSTTRSSSWRVTTRALSTPHQALRPALLARSCRYPQVRP